MQQSTSDPSSGDPSSGESTSHVSTSIKRTAILCLLLLTGAAAGYVLVKFTLVDRIKALDLESPWRLIVAFVPISYSIILAHELGHVVGGWLSGHRLHLLVVGPVRFRRDGNRLRVEWNGNMMLGGGLAICLPQQMDHFPLRRFVFVAMGPLSSFAVAAVCWWLSYVTTPFPFLSVCLMIGAAISLVIFVVTIVPQNAGGFQSDGAQLLSLLRGGAEAKKMNLFCVLQNLSMIGERPRDWDKELIASALSASETNDTLDAAVELFAYLHALDSEKINEAERHLAAAMERFERLPKGIREGFALEAAFFAAFYQQDLASAEAWHAEGEGGLVEPASRARVDAALLMLQKEFEPSRRKIDCARRLLSRSIDRGSVKVELDWLSEIERRLAVA